MIKFWKKKSETIKKQENERLQKSEGTLKDCFENTYY